MGAVGRVNRTLMEKLKKLTNFGSISWELKVKDATDGTNYSYNRSIRVSPYEFQRMKLPFLDVNQELGQSEIFVSKKELIDNRNRYISNYYEKDIVRGKKTVSRNLTKGDKVLIFKKKLGNKLGSSWIEDYKITGLIREDAYLISNGRSEIRINKKHFKLFFRGRRCRM